MTRRFSLAVFVVLPLLGAPGLAFAQSAPLTGSNAGTMHGQGWDMRQDLSSAPGPGAADPDRTRRVREQAARPRPAARSQAPRTTQQQQPRRRNVSPTGAPRQELTGTGTPGGRVSDSQRRHEAQMAEARRRQMEAERRAADAQDGVRLGR